MIKLHILKTWPEYFKRVLEGIMTFQVRRDDRDFEVKDLLELREYRPDSNEFTGRALQVRVVCILRPGPCVPLQEKYVIMGIRLVRIRHSKAISLFGSLTQGECDSCGKTFPQSQLHNIDLYQDSTHDQISYKFCSNECCIAKQKELREASKISLDSEKE